MERKRINNLEFREAVYLGRKPENSSWEIVKYEPNSYYGKEDYFIKDDEFYQDPEHSFIRIHKDCFKNKETCYSIALFNYDKEGYEVSFVGDRPLNLTSEEWVTFRTLLSYGYYQLNEEEYEN